MVVWTSIKINEQLFIVKFVHSLNKVACHLSDFQCVWREILDVPRILERAKVLQDIKIHSTLSYLRLFTVRKKIRWSNIPKKSSSTQYWVQLLSINWTKKYPAIKIKFFAWSTTYRVYHSCSTGIWYSVLPK